MAKTVVVTGAAGFIGTATCLRLLARGDRVIGLDNFCDYYSPLQKRGNLQEIESSGGNFEFLEGDLRDEAALERLFSKGNVDAVVHLAAMAGVRASAENPGLYADVNFRGTVNLLDAAIKIGRPTFVFASTSSAYGSTKTVPFVESDPCDRPLAPYPATKRAGELLGHSYHHLFGLPFTALRFFTVYGPRNRPDMMPFLLMKSMLEGAPIEIYEGGNVKRDWTFVEDIVSGIVSAADTPLGYEIVNLGRGDPILLSEFVSELAGLTGKKPNSVSRPLPAADVSLTFANIDKAKRLLNYAPKTSVAVGLQAFYEWYLKRAK
jgi:UDP-glucuronate 4-epimerase